MNIHTQSQGFDEAFVSKIEQAELIAPRIPLGYVGGQKLFPGTILRALNEGELDQRVIDFLSTHHRQEAMGVLAA